MRMRRNSYVGASGQKSNAAIRSGDLDFGNRISSKTNKLREIFQHWTLFDLCLNVRSIGDLERLLPLKKMKEKHEILMNYSPGQ